MYTPPLLLLLLTACHACRPQLPSDNGGDNGGIDTALPDSGDTEETADTAPPLPNRCDQLEVEPNNALDVSKAFLMEKWLCGAFLDGGSGGDTEFLNFTTTQQGWVSVTLEAASRGSNADAQFLLYSDESAVIAYDYVDSTDPRVVVPAAVVGTYGLVLGETGYLSGEGYDWAVMASLVKPPVDWTFQETEDNDDVELANPFTLGETVYGIMSPTADKDWYRLAVPDGLEAVVFQVEAFGSGSPVDARIDLYDIDGELKKTCYSAVIDYDLDPYCEIKQTEATEWTFKVTDEYDNGSAFSWYTLSVSGILAE